MNANLPRSLFDQPPPPALTVVDPPHEVVSRVMKAAVDEAGIVKSFAKAALAGHSEEGVSRGGPASAPRIDLRAPETLHPMLWLGSQLGRHGGHTIASGFAALDAQLPDGGWPRRVLTELLLAHPGVGEIRLLAPPLVATQREGRLVMLFDPPAALSPAALQPMGFDVAQLVIVHTKARVVAGSDSLWALEQALKSGHVGAVLAWLPPRLRADRLRRLQLAAHTHDGPAFALREMACEGRPTSSPLRLALRPAGADAIDVRVLKRRGPPLETPLQLALEPVLSNAARLRVRNAGNAMLQVETMAPFANWAAMG